jgi:nucleoside-triphosphatase THEP1
MIATLCGHSAALAGIDVRSPYRVSKYGVDIEVLDKVGVSAVREATRECDLVVIDEIGKMELFSPAFKEAVLEAINSGKRVLGTIMLSSHPWADEIKHRHDVAVIPLTRENRGQVLRQVLEWVKSVNPRDTSGLQ